MDRIRAESTPDTEHRRRRLLVAFPLAASVLALGLVLSSTGPPPTRVLGRQLVPASLGPNSATSCQTSAVAVSFISAYQQALPGPGFVVNGSTVSSIDPACAGAVLTLNLSSNGVPINGATGTVVVNGTSSTVTYASPPRASAVTGVSVQLAGGFAVPADCLSMTLQNNVTATAGSYTITGTSLADLIYGVAGPYWISGLEGNDCISAYDRNTVTDGNGDDVILASVGTGGSNTVMVGNGNDLVKLGDGTTSVTAGNGTDTVYAGNGPTTVVVGNGPDTFYGGTGPTSFTGGNGTLTIYTGGRRPTGPVPGSAGPATVTVGNGTDTIHAGNGNLTVSSGKNGNVTIYLSTGPGYINGGGSKNVCHLPAGSSYTITNCRVVTP